jgi:hypothetical protein
MTINEASDAFDANKTEDTARAYFETALEYWRDEAIDQSTLEFIAVEVAPFLKGV